MLSRRDPLGRAVSSNAVRRLLVDAEVLSPFNYAPGFPVFLPPGVMLVRRMLNTYIDRASREMDLVELSTPALRDARKHGDAYRALFEYTNVYELELPGGRYAVRPDSLAELISLGSRHHGRAILCQSPLFRAETADPQPLIRDKHIWGVAQVVQQVPERDASAALQLHSQVFLDFSTALLLPTLVVDAPALRDHAQARRLTFSTTPDGRTWLTSTLYRLAEPAARALGARGAVIELGFTSKLLALGSLLHSDQLGLRLPRTLASAELEICSELSAELAQQLGDAGLRTRHVPMSYSRGVRAAKRTGLPVVLGSSPEMIRAYWRATDRGVDLPMASAHEVLRKGLEQSDETLWEAAVSSQEQLFADTDCDCRVVDASAETAADFVLGHVVGGNYPLARTAAEKGALLVSRKRRLY